MCVTQTVVMFPPSLYFLDRITMCYVHPPLMATRSHRGPQLAFHWWHLQRPVSGPKDRLCFLCWLTLADAGGVRPGIGSAQLMSTEEQGPPGCPQLY